MRVEPQYLKVEGDESLIRDVSSHAIINTNDDEYRKHLEKRKHQLAQREELDKQKDDIDQLKNDMSEIKDLLKTLLIKADY